MNPRAVAAWSAAALTIVLVANHPVYRALVILLAINFMVARKRPGRQLGGLLRILLFATVVAVGVSMLLSHAGAHVLFVIPHQVPGLAGPVTLESAVFGLASGIGLSAAALAAAPLSLVVDPHQVVDALPRSLERAGATIAAALNMVPGIGRSYGAIRDAQSVRGWRPRGPRSYAEVLVPLVLTSMESSIQLAEAMEARAFGSGHRTRWMPEPWRTGDLMVVLTAAAATLVFIAARVTGLVADWYPYPVPTVPLVNPLALAGVLLLLTPMLVPRHD
ncbi:MAG: energy-coupling factor transporter transmembrane component T [Candidatus Dormiibacterota bacterium]